MFNRIMLYHVDTIFAKLINDNAMYHILLILYKSVLNILFG